MQNDSYVHFNIDQKLPTEIMSYFFKYFKATDCANTALVSKYWYQLTAKQQSEVLSLATRKATPTNQIREVLNEKMLFIKKFTGTNEELYRLCAADVDLARLCFANEQFFTKLTKDQASLLIYAHRFQVIEVAHDLNFVINIISFPKLIEIAEDDASLAKFILQSPGLSKLCDANHLVQIGHYNPEVAEYILKTPRYARLLNEEQKKELSDESMQFLAKITKVKYVP